MVVDDGEAELQVERFRRRLRKEKNAVGLLSEFVQPPSTVAQVAILSMQLGYVVAGEFQVFGQPALRVAELGEEQDVGVAVLSQIGDESTVCPAVDVPETAWAGVRAIRRSSAGDEPVATSSVATGASIVGFVPTVIYRCR